ncbi:purine nucleoside phosphorylase, putative [Eimeria maxima]|uniref:Purine nucleoside phosphorylase, putative n=1 Tax=Eimeria maxima TaxID=5804 RepID=U6M4B3_EIMMA|nr:purine nucleoside phosphorylase, putative [Eimeria maxima]CDJ57289.1 purine nucleoside phosphorylase, putative [Eimeria maxima]
MEGVEVQPHIKLRKEDEGGRQKGEKLFFFLIFVVKLMESRGQVHPVVLTMGDPARVDEVKELCDSYEDLVFNREYKSANVVKNGYKFTVISHGIGCCGAMICFEELIKLGAKIIIRAGTCGSMKPNIIKQGEIVIPYAAARDNDVCDLYIPVRRGIETGGIATVDGSPLQWDKANYDPTGKVVAEGKKKMLEVAIHTCAELTKEFKQ